MKNERTFRKFDMILDLILSIAMIMFITPVYGIIVYANCQPEPEYEIITIKPEPIVLEDLVEDIKVESVQMTQYAQSPPEPKIVNIIEAETKIEPEYRMIIDEETYNILVRVTEAEVTGETYTYKGEHVSEEEMLLAKIRVAQVFMNRVEDNDSFARIDSLYESLTEKNASSTFNDGRYYEVEITDLTIEAVNLALLADTPDYTDGALYFSSGTTKNKYADYIFTDDVGHSFFK